MDFDFDFDQKPLKERSRSKKVKTKSSNKKFKQKVKNKNVIQPSIGRTQYVGVYPSTHGESGGHCPFEEYLSTEIGHDTLSQHDPDRFT
jgi:hypothetical protein